MVLDSRSPVWWLGLLVIVGGIAVIPIQQTIAQGLPQRVDQLQHEVDQLQQQVTAMQEQLMALEQATKLLAVYDAKGAKVGDIQGIDQFAINAERLFEKSSIGGISSVHSGDERQSIPHRPHGCRMGLYPKFDSTTQAGWAPPRVGDAGSGQCHFLCCRWGHHMAYAPA
jgi:outer membrane murein-binding lipoprotein Lpp